MSTIQLAGPSSGHCWAGNDQSWEFTVTRDGVALDVTGMTFRFVMARRVGVTPALTTEGGSPTATAAASTPAQGKFAVAATAANCAALRGTYQYQAQVQDQTGKKSNVLHGYFTFKENLI